MKYIGYPQKSFFFEDSDMFVWVETETFENKINSLMDLNVMEIATKRVITVQPEIDIDLVAKILGEKKIKKVVVVSDKKLAGIISRGDIVRFVVKNYLDPG